MAWFFRAVQGEDGTWLCRRGLTVLDLHTSLDEAVEHLRRLASEDGPAVLVLHWGDGRVEQLD